MVFVTGAARGIGAGTARALAPRGARLILVDLDEAPLREIGAEIGEDRERPPAAGSWRNARRPALDAQYDARPAPGAKAASEDTIR